MAIGKQRCWIVASSSCALLMLLVAASSPAARSSLEIDESAQYSHTTASATAGVQGSNLASVHTSEGVTEVVPNDEPKPVADYRDCYKVCCWQGDPDCPYPYCNYNEVPCSGGEH